MSPYWMSGLLLAAINRPIDIGGEACCPSPRAILLAATRDRDN
jgi:hypothetical protein